MEIAVGKGAAASGGDDGKFGIISQESGRRIRCRRGVDNIAAERAAVLVGDAASPAGGLGEDREFVSNDGVFAYISESAARANDNRIRGDFDETQFFEVPERDKFFGL